MGTHLKIRRNIPLFKINYFCLMCWPLSALAIVYFESITNSYAQAMGIFSIATITQALGEVPTGVLSDRVGRRLTMIIAAFCSCISFSCFALAGNYQSTLLLIIGAVFWGFDDSFMSGTDEALIYDTMTEFRKQHKYDIVFSKSKIFHQIGGVFSSFISICVLYFYSLHVLAWISVIPAVVRFVACFFFVEPNINTAKDVNAWEHLKHAWNNIKNNSDLKKIAVLTCCSRAVDMASYRMENVYFSQLIEKYLVSVVVSLRQLCGAISFYISPFFRKFGFLRILVVSTFGNVFFRTVGVVLNNAFAPFIMALQNLSRGTTETASSALMQKEFSSAQRATMGSLISLVGGFVMAFAYYVSGLIADIWSVYFAVILLIIIKSFIGFLYIRLMHKM